jgi:hypothetical protein
MLTYTRHTFIAGLLLGLAWVMVGSTPGHAALVAPEHPGYHRCVQEDSPGPCWWDAARQGNGVGQSFWVDRAQVIHYGHLHWRVITSATPLPDSHRCRHDVASMGDATTCLTVGPWHRIGQPLADALAEGGAPDATTRDWSRLCYQDRVPGVGILVACRDGEVFLS